MASSSTPSPPPTAMPPLAPTPGQTVGPFFGYGMPYPRGAELVTPYSPGAIVLSGRVLDGSGAPVPDAQLEIWQADAVGNIPTEPGSLRRDGVTFTGFGRAETDVTGTYRFWTVNPGSVSSATGSDGAPFISAIVFARGLQDRLFTRIYLPEDEAALASDPLLRGLSAEERATMIAERAADGWLHHDIHLQGNADGQQETVFLAFS